MQMFYVREKRQRSFCMTVAMIRVTHRRRIYFFVHANAWANVRVCLACKVAPPLAHPFSDPAYTLLPLSLSLFLCLSFFLHPSRVNVAGIFRRWSLLLRGSSLHRKTCCTRDFPQQFSRHCENRLVFGAADSATHCLSRELLALSSLAVCHSRCENTSRMYYDKAFRAPMPTPRDARHRTPT